MNRNSKNARFLCSSGLSLIVLSAQTVMGGAAFAQSTAAPTDTVSVEQVVVTGSRLTTGFTTPTPVQDGRKRRQHFLKKAKQCLVVVYQFFHGAK